MNIEQIEEMVYAAERQSREDNEALREEMQQQLDSIKAELEALKNPEPEEPPGLLPEAERIAAVPAWDAERVYHEGEVCRYQDRLWIALLDITGFPPDETYHGVERTSRWMPV
jgi:hypothetical protein